jgi:hypothetical protein
LAGVRQVIFIPGAVITQPLRLAIDIMVSCGQLGAELNHPNNFINRNM